MRDAVYIIKNLREAELLHNSPPETGAEILSLSPAMEKVLRRETNARIITLDEVYSDISHIKTIIYVKNCIAEFMAIAKNLGTLSKLQIEVMLYNIFYIYSTAAVFYQVMKKYQKFYFFKKGKLTSSKNFEEAFIAIMSELFADSYADKEHNFSALHRYLMAAHNAYLICKFKKRKKLLILDGARPSSKSFATEILKLDENFAVIKAKNPAKSVFSAIHQVMKSRQKNNYPIYFLYPARSKNYGVELNQTINLTKSNFHKLVLQSAKPFLSELLTNAAGYEANSQMQKLLPQLITSDTFYKPSILATVKAGAGHGAKIIMFNHASHTPQSGSVSKTIGNLWALLGRVQTPYATQIAARSPATAELVEEIAGSEKLVNLKTIERVKPAVKDKFNFLFAGNYLPVERHVPWLTEDAYEFSKGLDELIDAIAKFPDASLTIRIKDGKSEFDMEALRQKIASYPNIKIGNDGSFQEALTRADIIVANISTTIDEALQSGVPVLLHSHRKRYRHLPAMTASPSEKVRSAVYASSRKIPLVELLENIIKAHNKKPLTNTELAPYIWPENTTDMPAFAKQILEQNVSALN